MRELLLTAAIGQAKTGAEMLSSMVLHHEMNYKMFLKNDDGLYNNA